MCVGLVISAATLLIEHSDVFEGEHGHHGSFRSRYNEGPLRLFTRQRALALAPTSRQPSLPPPPPPPPSARAPLPLRQPYPWSFSHTTPPLAINAREKVGARSRSRPLHTPSPLSLPISFSPPPTFSDLSFCFSRRILRLSLDLSRAVALIRAAGAKMPETRRDTRNATRLNDDRHLRVRPRYRYLRCQSESRLSHTSRENPRHELPSRYRARGRLSIDSRRSCRERSLEILKTSTLARAPCSLSLFALFLFLRQAATGRDQRRAGGREARTRVA